MTWDITLPLGTESASNGDNRIRETREDIQTALRGNAAEGTEAVFPGSDTANPVFRYRGLKGSTGARPTAGDYGLYLDTTRNAVQRDNGTSWDDFATLIPAGTVMVFYQAAAPTGWTKVTTQNDKALRVVSGTGGSTGGSLALSSSLTHTHTIASHTHDMGNHTHTMGNHTHSTPSHSHPLDSLGTLGSRSATTGVGSLNSDGSEIVNYGTGGSSTIRRLSNQTTSSGSGTSGSPSSNTSDAPSTNTTSATVASMDSGTLGALAYIDVLICSKD